MTPPNCLSVQRASIFCSRRMQNDVFPEPLGLLTIHENGCLNLISTPLMYGRAMARPYSHCPYLYPNGTDLLSPSRRLLKNGFGDYRYGSAPYFLRLIFLSVRTFTTVGSSPLFPLGIMSLITSKFTIFDA